MMVGVVQGYRSCSNHNDSTVAFVVTRRFPLFLLFGVSRMMLAITGLLKAATGQAVGLSRWGEDTLMHGHVQICKFGYICEVTVLAYLKIIETGKETKCEGQVDISLSGERHTKVSRDLRRLLRVA